MIASTNDLTHTLAIFGLPGGAEWIAMLLLGLLLFGRRLPEVGRSIGRSIVESKRGIREIEDDVDTESKRSPDRIDSRPDPGKISDESKDDPGIKQQEASRPQETSRRND